MSRKQRQRQKRDSPATAWLCSADAYESLCVSGYTRVSDCPEVQTAVGHIARLIGSMTIYLMRNTKKGDIREKNELSRKIDIFPYHLTTRQLWMEGIVKNMLINGNQIVYPQLESGRLTDLIPLPPDRVIIHNGFDGYTVECGGQIFQPDEILHFAVNPSPDFPWYGLGYRAVLRDVAQNLRQAAATKKGFMESKWKPSIIVKVDGLTEEFASKSGRKKLLTDYLDTTTAGEPWLIPAEQFDIEQVKPLSLSDLALNEAVEMDRKTAASIIGVPPYVVGAGNFNAEEHRHFIDTKIMPIAKGIAQELSRKLLLSPDLYFKLSGRALYGYDISQLAKIGQDLAVRGLMLGNEVRDWLDLTPVDGLDERIILENYIPADRIGDQKKLKGGEN